MHVDANNDNRVWLPQI